ncbi:conserved hypothetical protein (plasmid) [Deferribacter desulfuricans SSM1]|uniref:AbiEi antitoxin C-terminal domain-containing protein n=1 Tax=Deferribacter desulfuricans (strain DSM 14783 / JCM 11476 / NBRC 101012 / SSM1) TaxID=639282 RepID=D3PF90_DEFDS|nr:DUF6088 family protein [Deferribacter desulfuricans]BAI81882.1 conserved hypothetical protein [Deferribacter desulfuricans SSM1]
MTRIRDYIKTIPEGTVFTINDVKRFNRNINVNSLATTLSKLAKEGYLKRIGRGKYYRPKNSYLGELPVTWQKVAELYLYDSGYRKRYIGYITGLALYNHYKLSTQVPSELTIATKKRKSKTTLMLSNGMRLSLIPLEFPIRTKDDIRALQYLDLLKYLKQAIDVKPENVIRFLQNELNESSPKFIKKIIGYSLKYSPFVRALLGVILDNTKYRQYASYIKDNLNPLTKFKINFNTNLTNLKKWNIIKT